MKGITVPKKFLKADGMPFTVGKRDANGESVYKRNDKGDILYEVHPGKEAPIAIPLVERETVGWLPVLKETLENIQNSMLREKVDKKEAPGLTWEDTVSGVSIYRAIAVTPEGEMLELEDTPYKWLVEKLHKYGPEIYGLNAFVIAEPLEQATDLGKERAERRREAGLSPKVVDVPCKT